ncbi:MAG: Glycosyltransferase [uncultured bacterium]|nr:MAG: Glycosyltransferase [uncultured bacterium]
MEIALVIPAYNEESTIENVVNEVSPYIKNIIIVNDCSNDSTEEILKKMPVKIINNQKNFGYTKTLEKGIREAFKLGADYVITYDADGQHQTSDLVKYIAIIKDKKPDLIIGNRSIKNRFMEQIFSIYSKLKYGFSDPLCGMKAYKRSLFEKYGQLENRYSIATEFTFRAIKDGASFFEIPIQTEKRLSKSRFANSLKGNLLELKAFLNILFI